MPNYWLVKSEPSAYSWDDLVRDGVAEWDGVRNYTARNFMRDAMQPDDLVLFYHSAVNPPAVVGVAKVVRAGYPDHTAWDAASEHPDPKSTPEKPIWYMVDIAPLYPLPHPVPLDEVKRAPELSEMALVRQGRLSVQPVTEAEFKLVLSMGGAG